MQVRPLSSSYPYQNKRDSKESEQNPVRDPIKFREFRIKGKIAKPVLKPEPVGSDPRPLPIVPLPKFPKDLIENEDRPSISIEA